MDRGHGSSSRRTMPRSRPPAQPYRRRKTTRANYEMYGWLFMRMSGVVLLVLVFGAPVRQPRRRRGHQPDRLRASSPASGPAPFWQVWDLLMLWLAMMHGTNGVRTIINDYAERDGTRLWLKMAAVLRVRRRHRRSARSSSSPSTRAPTRRDAVARAAVLLPRLTAPARRRRATRAGGAPMQTHKYDVVIVGAGGAGMRAALESRQAGPHGGAHQALPDALAHRCGAGRHVRRPGERRGGQLGVAHLRHRQGRRLPRRPGRRGGDVPARRSTPSSTWRRWACRSTGPPRARIDQRRFGGHTRNHGEAAVRRSCFAADRTGHMILQTLYQQCVKHEVEFFNEFYVLDLLHATDVRPARAADRRRRRLRARDRRDARLPGEVGRVRHRRLRQGLQDDVERAHPHRRRDGHRLPARPAAGGHGVLPVPPDRPGGPGDPAVRGRARRGRDPAQQRGRALHGALRPDHQGPRAPRHRRPVDGERGPRGARLRARARTTCCST